MLILFITIPLVELYLLALVGSRVGPLPTIMLVILTGAWGAYLAKSQGYSILARIQAETAAGRVPTAELIDGLLVLIGGIVLADARPADRLGRFQPHGARLPSHHPRAG